MQANRDLLTFCKACALALAVLLLGLGAVLWTELPAWQTGGTRSTPISSVGLTSEPLSCPPAGTAIAMIGDSHVAGGRIGDGGGKPFGRVFEQAIAGRVTVSLHGIGGHTAFMGEQAWRGRDIPEAGLMILAFGTNDAAPRGWLRDKAPVALADFKASLGRQIAHWRARGHEVVLLAPPPGGSAAISGRLAPYRTATRAVGETLGTPVLDPADAFAACPSAQPVLTRDALHMNARGHQCLGTWLAHQFCPPTS